MGIQQLELRVRPAAHLESLPPAGDLQPCQFIDQAMQIAGSRQVPPFDGRLLRQQWDDLFKQCTHEAFESNARIGVLVALHQVVLFHRRDRALEARRDHQTQGHERLRLCLVLAFVAFALFAVLAR